MEPSILKNTISSCVNIFRHNGFDDFELLILDNASTDNSVDVIHDVLGGLPFVETTFIKSKVNHGFAKGCNILSKIAKREILYFLNNDTMSLDASEFIGLIRAGRF
ncbi:putative glycosyl transferase family protein [Escherichia coli]|uniref:Putative glycosyl transferase family protein n=1 Tax=Escherichia coli TaxID=562 RepID=A0A377D7E8_ECOLX|nr:putative glycosyl transferase family protein [Escherichia coli]